MAPLEHRHILRLEPLAHAPERPQKVPQPRPGSLHRVAMHLAYAISVHVDRPRALGARVVHRHMDPVVPATDSTVATPLIGVDCDPRQARPVHELVQFLGPRRLHHLQPDLARLAAHNSDHRRSVVGKGPVAPPAVGSAPRRVVRVGMRNPFLAGILVHLVALDHVVGQRVTVEPPPGVLLHPTPQFQQVLAIATQFAGQLRRGYPLGEAAEDEHDLGGPAVRALEIGVGEGVEDTAAGGAAVVENRGAVAAMDTEMIIGFAFWAGQALWVKQGDEFVVAGVLVHEVDQGEVHRGVSRVSVGSDRKILAILGAISRESLTKFAS